MRENVYHNSWGFQERMKNTFDREIKKDYFSASRFSTQMG